MPLSIRATREDSGLGFADKYLLLGSEEITADFPGETKLMLDTRRVGRLKRSLPESPVVRWENGSFSWNSSSQRPTRRRRHPRLVLRKVWTFPLLVSLFFPNSLLPHMIWSEILRHGMRSWFQWEIVWCNIIFQSTTET